MLMMLQAGQGLVPDARPFWLAAPVGRACAMCARGLDEKLTHKVVYVEDAQDTNMPINVLVRVDVVTHINAVGFGAGMHLVQ